MIKFLNRPFIALAAGLSVIFVIILLNSYVTLLNDLTESFSEDKVIDDKTVRKIKPSSYVYGPQLPTPLDEYSPKPSKNIPVTLGTFEALNGTCFLQHGREFSFQEPDFFTDLKDAVDEVQQSYSSSYDDDNSTDDKTDDDQTDEDKTEDSDDSDEKALDTLGSLLSLHNRDQEENSYHKFVSEISRYQMYSPESDAVNELLYDIQTQPIYKISEVDMGTQFKLRVVHDNGVVALLKPKRTPREQQALPNQYFFAELERHTSEIAAYHLDRILGFYRALPTIGRNVDMIVELLRIAEAKLQRTFFVSPKPDENLCFTGTCAMFCDSYHPICGNGTEIEVSLSAYFPEAKGADRMITPHPWVKPSSEKEKAKWESNPDYCSEVKMKSEFSQGRLLLELIDLSIFDFLTGNMDRHDYQQFRVFSNDTFVVSCDHGRAFGHAYHDDLRILAPMLQCCMIRSSTLQTLVEIHNSETPLSERMRKSMSTDPIAPVLWEPHLDALDRRLVIVLQAVRDCISRHSIDDVIIADNNEDF